jgi:hypothetical protein
VIVLDANVAAKWYIPERGSEAAIELITGCGGPASLWRNYVQAFFDEFEGFSPRGNDSQRVMVED